MKSVQETVALVEGSFSSIFSKEDVVSMLKNLEMPKLELPKGFMEELVQEITAGVERKLKNMDRSNIVEFGSAEFDISYGNKLELTDVEVNTDSIVEEVQEVVEKVLEKVVCKMFPKEEESDIVELEKGC